MNFKHLAFTVLATATFAGQASASLTTVTWSTSFDAISTFNGVAFGAPTAVNFSVEIDPASGNLFSMGSMLFQATTVTMDIAGFGVYTSATPQSQYLALTDENYKSVAGFYQAALVNAIVTSGIAGLYSTQSQALDFTSGNPLPQTIALSGNFSNMIAGPYTIALTSGDTVVLDPVAAVPEPATLALLGLAGLAFLRRRNIA